MKKRTRKKIYKKVIPNVCADLSQNSIWRKKLFSSSETFKVDGKSIGVCESDLNKITRHKLKILVTTCSYNQLPQDCFYFSKDFINFKFWTEEFPSLAAYSSNNPDIT